MKHVLCVGIIASVILTGCVVSNAPNLVGKRGNYVTEGKTLADIRSARRGIKVFSEIPSTAYNIRELTVKRCHQNFTEEAPSTAIMEDDLVLEAYARGADGLANIKHTKTSGLLKNCWHVRTATAQSFRLD